MLLILSISDLISELMILDLLLTQAVHDATKLSELVLTRKQMQNLLDYNINKHMRNQSNRPVIKVNSHLQIT